MGTVFDIATPGAQQRPADTSQIGASADNSMLSEGEVLPGDGGWDNDGLTPPPRKKGLWKRFLGLALILLGLAAGGAVFMLHNAGNGKNQAASTAGLTGQSSLLKTQAASLGSIEQQLQGSTSQTASTLTVNGQLSVNGSLVLQSSAQPGSPVAGQLYFDQSNNQLGYYNGTSFIYLQGAGANGGAGSGAGAASGTTLTGTSGTIPVVSGVNSLAASLLSQGGSVVTVAGSLNVQGGAYQVNGAQIASSNLADSSNLARLNASQTFTGGNTFQQSANSATAFQILNAAGDNVLTADTTDNTIVLGKDNTASPTAITVRGGAAAGNNLIGANLTFKAPDGTGVGGSGNIVFQTAGGVSNPLVTVDATAGAEQVASNATLSWTHTTGSQSDRVLIVAVDTASTTNPSTATGVTYGGQALTLLTSIIGGTLYNNNANGSVWYMVNPPTGAHTVSVSLTGTASDVGAESTTFYNVDTANPIATYTTNKVYGSSVTTTLSGTSAGEGVFDALMARASFGTAISTGAGQTILYDQSFYNDANYGSFRQGDSGSTTMSWTSNGVSDLDHVVIALNPEPNLTPDPFSEVLRLTQNGTLGVDLNTSEDATATLAFGGSTDRSIAVNQNPGTGNGHNLTLQAGGGAYGGNNNGGNLILQGGSATGGGTAGGVIVKPQADSAQAFVVQNATGSAFLTADSANLTVTVTNLVVSTALTINGHVVTGGAAPTIAAGPAACTTPTVSIAGNDTTGTITVTTGSGCSAGGILATVTFASAFGAAPHVILTPSGASAQQLGEYVNGSTVSTTSFAIGTASTPTSTTTYTWNYWVAQ